MQGTSRGPEADRSRHNRPQLTFERALAITAKRCAATGLYFDFDGTLAPIQEDPDTVRPIDGVLQPLERLSQAVRRIAIVSARPVSFLHSRFSELTHVALYGLYGLEALQPGQEVVTDEQALSWVDTILELTAQARHELPAPVRVEYKRLSVALHYRGAPTHQIAVEAWADAQAVRFGLRRQDGRMVVELKPPIQRDKGEVIRTQVADLTCAWYFGDDLGDIAAFHQLQRQELQNRDFVGVRALVANPETGAQLVGQSDFQIESPYEMPRYLTRIADSLQG